MNLGMSLGVAAIVAVTAGTAWGQCESQKAACGSQKSCATQTAALSVMGPADIVDTAVAAGKFNTLAAALKAAGLIDTLKSKGPFTVFAPTDEAFAKLPKGAVEMLLKPENKDKLTAILTYHVVPGSVMAADAAKLSGATTVNGQRVDISASHGGVMVDGAKVVQADIAASNGVIHVIDTVIMPADKNIVETAAAAGKFTTLAAALKAAGLDEALKGKGPYTVFAPTDEAFAKLPKETLAALLKPDGKDKLAAILKYHVVEGRIYSTDALKAGTAQTLQGNAVTISSHDGVTIDRAKLIKADIDASNGVIHVIDTVLMPRN